MDEKQSYVIDNLVNEFREDEMYKEALLLFPELIPFKKEEVLVQIKSIVKNRKERREAKNNNDVDMPNRRIFIDNVICNDTKFTDEEVRDHVYTIVAAGSETTALQTAHTSRTTMNS
jgi:cytochrome P450